MLVATAATEGFLAPVTAMLHSLGEATGDERVDAVVLHDAPLSTRGRGRVEASAADVGVAVRFLPVASKQLRRYPPGAFPPVIWARVLLPELLPDEEKVLYLDADTLVVDSPLPLWRVDVGEAPMAAVANPLYGFMRGWPRTAIGVEDPRRYINSGVLLMNLALLRRERCSERLLDYAATHRDNPYPEQDAISAVLGHRVLPLHPRWNAQTTLWDVALADLPFPASEVQEARERPAIVHFIGPFKPWHYLCTHPYGPCYFEHLAATPWPPPPLEGRTLVNRVVKRLSPTWVNRSLRLQARLAAGRVPARS